MSRAGTISLLLLIAGIASGRVGHCCDNPEGEDNRRFQVRRARTLVFDSTVTRIPPIVAGVTSVGSKSVWTGTVAASSLKVTSMSLHIATIVGTRAAWRLRIRPSDSEEWTDTITGKSVRGRLSEFWTTDIPGNQAVLELTVDEPATAFRIVTDGYTSPALSSVPQSIWGTNDMRPIDEQPLDVRRLGGAIARLRIKTRLGEALCTGFLVSEALLMTNAHCIASEVEAVNTQADFGFDGDGTTPVAFPVLGIASRSADPALDYVVVRVGGDPGTRFGYVYLPLHGGPTGEADWKRLGTRDLLLIEHPGGGPKMISRTDCTAVGRDVAGISAQKRSDFRHHCDTLGGSSGSPVFSASKLELVGLHHLGEEEGSSSLKNQAVYIGLIVTDICTRTPELLQGISTCP